MDDPTPATPPGRVTQALEAARIASERAAAAEARVLAHDADEDVAAVRERWATIREFVLSRNFIVATVAIVVSIALLLAAVTGQLAEIVRLLAPASWLGPVVP